MESQAQEKTIPQILDTEVPGTITKQSSTIDQPWQEWLEPLVDLLSNASDYIGQWFNTYRQLLTTLGIVLLAIISVKIIVAVLGAISDIPLLAPVLQLVGLTHTAWFVWRYLWKASNRQELIAEFDALKNQIFGENA
ncbi:CAAD domain-containing protein [Cyanobacterium sp. uoEpiScrs1]|uniref:CAAD domain-containing protein n=1 Tax=Cyanobacterium sp. uoEpiScrs1 TaxID=2976343 RepID=UPI002269FD4C|nr:CAAD domain-containing protein [Cyanobacterium sp. uoEpiScrs1]